MQVCKTKIVISPSASVGAFFQKFIRNGTTADFTDGRGVRSKVVTIDYQATGIKTYARNKVVTFDYDQELNDARILGIELLSTGQLLFAPTQPLKDTPQSELAKGFLIIKDNCNNIIQTTPLANLCKALNGNKSTFVDYKNIDWGSSGVVFNGAATISSANAIPFRVYFQ